MISDLSMVPHVSDGVCKEKESEQKRAGKHEDLFDTFLLLRDEGRVDDVLRVGGQRVSGVVFYFWLHFLLLSSLFPPFTRIIIFIFIHTFIMVTDH